MKTIPHSTLDAFLREQGAPVNDDDAPGDASRYLLSEMREPTKTMLAFFGMTWDDTNIYLHDDWNIKGIRAYTSLVDACYENVAVDDGEMMTWGPLFDDFGGDDDVDYNASYIDCVVDALEAYLA